MKDEPTGSPPLSADQLAELNKKLEETLGPAPQASAKPEPAERFRPAEPAPESSKPAETTETTPVEDTEDAETDKAVDDIAAKEGDELLAAEDKAKALAAAPEKKTGLKNKLKAIFNRWWHNKPARYATLGGLAVIIVGLLAFPTTRYFMLNTLSVRSRASLTVLDDSTSLPLKNVTVSLGGQTAQSDENGNVNLYHVKLGRSDLVINKLAFASQSHNLVVGWGSNPLGSYNLHPVGTQFAFTVRDFLSDKPIAKAQAESANAGNPLAGAALADNESSIQANAQSDDKGKILLTVDKPGDQLAVTIKAQGYRDETITIKTADKNDRVVKLVPARKELFISKRSGKYDLYTIDLDGKNEKLILPGTGNEQDNMALIPHPTAEVAAYISTRDNVRNNDGFLLSTLNLVDVKTGQLTKLTQSERIQAIDWIGNRLIYVAIAAGASAANPRRERLVAYDYQTNSSTELAATNYFNDVLVANGYVYYATSSSYQNGNNIGFFRINPSGTTKTRLLNQEVWNIFRTSYDVLNLSVKQQWYSYRLSSNTVTKANGAPPVLRSRIYLDNPIDKNSLWVDNRDGKGVLLLYDLTHQKDKILKSQSGLQYPLRWINATTLIYRIHTDQESADYAMSTLGGEPRKLSDVTNTAGVSTWYYY